MAAPVIKLCRCNLWPQGRWVLCRRSRRCCRAATLFAATTW